MQSIATSVQVAIALTLVFAGLWKILDRSPTKVAEPVPSYRGIGALAHRSLNWVDRHPLGVGAVEVLVGGSVIESIVTEAEALPSALVLKQAISAVRGGFAGRDRLVEVSA
jgi:hypothetical protein